MKKEDEIFGAPTTCTACLNKVLQGNVITNKKYLNSRNIMVKNVARTFHLDSKFK